MNSLSAFGMYSTEGCSDPNCTVCKNNRDYRKIIEHALSSYDALPEFFKALDEAMEMSKVNVWTGRGRPAVLVGTAWHKVWELGGKLLDSQENQGKGGTSGVTDGTKDD